MDSELSLIRFGVGNYFSILLSSRPMLPIASLLVKIVDSLIKSESEPNKEHQKKIMWIKENTHENVNIPIAIVELAVFRNLAKNLVYEVEIDGESFRIIDLYNYVDDAIYHLNEIVIDISRKYAIDLPVFQSKGSDSTELKIT